MGRRVKLKQWEKTGIKAMGRRLKLKQRGGEWK